MNQNRELIDDEQRIVDRHERCPLFVAEADFVRARRLDARHPATSRADAPRRGFYLKKKVEIQDERPGIRMTSISTSVSASMNVQTCGWSGQSASWAMLVVMNRSGAVGGDSAPI